MPVDGDPPVKIIDIQTKPYVIPFRSPIRMSSHRMEELPVLLVRVRTDEGIEGFGETYCFQAVEAIIHHQIKPVVLQEDPFELEKMAALCLNRFPLVERPEISVSAFAAVEMACWDILGKHLHQPVYRLLGGGYRKRVPVTAFLGLAAPQELRREAARAVEMGFRTIKVKTGREAGEDVELVKAVRAEVGHGIELRVDPNQAWTVATALRQIRKMARYDPQYIEQPIPRWDLEGLAHLRRLSPVPIGVCEGAFTVYRIMHLVMRKAVDFLSTDPVRMGGLLQAKKMSAIAEAAGVSVVTHISEGDVQTAAWLHWIASTPRMGYANDLSLVGSGTGWVRSDAIVANPIEAQDGMVAVPEGEGLGVEIDEDKLAHYASLYVQRYGRTELGGKLDQEEFPPYPLY